MANIELRLVRLEQKIAPPPKYCLLIDSERLPAMAEQINAWRESSRAEPETVIVVRFWTGDNSQ